ncbi:MAG: hypothetical protein NPIRA06_34320 [Nitrospirales bacterium]|nr:MAG: hypothetical protein NPIRA06_34320 [Nitrospirales bacterium]
MINAVPFFFGPPESPSHVTGQTGGLGLDQAKTTENSSNHLFAKIFRDHSGPDSLQNNVSNTTPGKGEGKLSNFELPLGTTVVSDDNLWDLFLAGVLAEDEQRVTEEGDGQRITEEADVGKISSILLAAEGLNGSRSGLAVSQKALFGLLSGNVPQDRSVSGVVVSPHAFLNGARGGQTGLSLVMGNSPNQTASVGNILVDSNGTDLVTKVDPQQVLRNPVSSVAGEAVTEPYTNQGKPGEPFSGLVQGPGPRLSQNPLSPMGLPQKSLKPVGTPFNQAFQLPKPFEDTPAGIADAGQLSQNRLKFVSGASSVLSESSANGKESSIGIPLNLPADANVSVTGDRSRDGLEATGKGAGIDPNAGQGLNHGMGNPTHSQPGFQQPSSASSPGAAVRMAEERVPDLPGPALQRLQMEVQLSETNRVQIDVGVQHRQVYASLLMDQATLKNLAVQFVPQLEEQLTQGDMELQEFSAEVRDQHGERESSTRSDGAGTQTSQRGTMSLHPASGSPSHVGMRVDEQGLHLVA